MATKKCPNGHQYDSTIYGDNCTFCPSSGHTRVNNDFGGGATQETIDWSNIGEDPTKTMQEAGGGGRTIIRNVGNPDAPNPDGGRRLVGVLVSYSANPAGEVYKVYEGRTTIGRDRTCDISFPTDQHMSSQHFLIQYVEAKGAFRAQEYAQGSANGSYVNGQVYVLGDVIDLKTNDIIVLGGTKFVFLAIPEF